MEIVVVPLLHEAHGRLAAQEAGRGPTTWCAAVPEDACRAIQPRSVVDRDGIERYMELAAAHA